MTGDDGVTSNRSPGEFSLESIPLHSTDLLTVLDEGGIIKYESPAIERIFGFSQDELVGEQVADYFHPDDRQQVLDTFCRVVEAESDTHEAVEFRHRMADGSYQWVESVSSSNSTPDGSYVVSTREIGDRKRRERELERKNERLDRFASVISHDLRNPLTVANLRLDLASEECDSEHLVDVAQAHDRMERLITELLMLARSETHAHKPEQVDLSRFAKRCWQNVSTGDATLVTATDRQIQADRSQLAQLLENLFRNAVEHSSQQRESVTVSVADLDGRDGFAVADDGPGIASERLGRVFESGHTTKQNGTGIGLSIVETIVRAHGWEITIDESDAGGAQFEISGVDLV